VEARVVRKFAVGWGLLALVACTTTNVTNNYGVDGGDDDRDAYVGQGVDDGSKSDDGDGSVDAMEPSDSGSDVDSDADADTSKDICNGTAPPSATSDDCEPKDNCSACSLEGAISPETGGFRYACAGGKRPAIDGCKQTGEGLCCPTKCVRLSSQDYRCDYHSTNKQLWACPSATGGSKFLPPPSQDYCSYQNTMLAGQRADLWCCNL